MNDSPDNPWTADALLTLGRSYQGAAVLAAAAELGVFAPLAASPKTAVELAAELRLELRGLVTLLDALAALRLLTKNDAKYSLASGLNDLLTPTGRQTVLAMCQHQANCLRRWAQLAKVVKSGLPTERVPSVRGEQGDEESFIGAMDNISAPMADSVIQALQPLAFRHLLDLGGASGTWTMEFLRTCPEGRATLFDLPPVIPMAQKRLKERGFLDRVKLVPGDFMTDQLPAAVDLAWVSAIVHQNSQEQNRVLFRKIFKVLVPGGRIAIRDVVMNEKRTEPVAGALFAINMLVATQGGGTFTFAELSQDLKAAGFSEPMLVRKDDGMNSLVEAWKD